MALTLNKRESKEPAAKRKKATRSERSFLSTLIIRYGLLIAAIALFIIFSFLEPRFITPRNIFKIIGQGSVIGLMALGLTIIVVAGEFDISFAAVATLCCVLSVFLIGALGMNIFLCSSCKWNWRGACRNPARPNATWCPEYQKRGK